ncbi:hypothetical protein J2T14_004390 [Paenibacillus harenae]|nr:hypothetical protein [Paenibacillus harenae]
MYELVETDDSLPFDVSLHSINRTIGIRASK